MILCSDVHSKNQKPGVWLCEDNCESYGARMRAAEDDETTLPLGSLATIAVVGSWFYNYHKSYRTKLQIIFKIHT